MFSTLRLARPTLRRALLTSSRQHSCPRNFVSLTHRTMSTHPSLSLVSTPSEHLSRLGTLLLPIDSRLRRCSLRRRPLHTGCEGWRSPVRLGLSRFRPRRRQDGSSRPVLRLTNVAHWHPPGRGRRGSPGRTGPEEHEGSRRGGW